MRKHQAYREWVRVVTTKMSHLSKPQAVVLAMWSFGMVMTGSCGLSTVAVFLAQLSGKKENTVRQQLREFYQDRLAKKGTGRAELEVRSCFAPLLAWILSWWSPAESRLALALDASHLGSRFTLLVVSVVYRGCGIPVAWKILPANQAGSWQPYWQELLLALRPAVPSHWFVVVTADRGLYAKWLYQQIQQRGWHPFLRINQQGQVRLPGREAWLPLNALITAVGQSWAGRVCCFKNHPLHCTLLARWESDYADPWLIVSDLDPDQADICWYGMRCWIEGLFKDTKRGGWQWHHTKMSDPQRAERLWLAMAVATLWLVSVGGQADAHLSPSSLPSLASVDEAQQPSRWESTSSPRRLSCFRRGALMILAAVINHLQLPLGCFVPKFSSA